eukprot:CAMPEP_0172152682 /NCGR_PEP_ID=MMETSP1050-20130122/989_1 /TAXON_ID=233186 /ORGANISM="Cryptomonas curvata, Strain CCAP979/52" /LENGTH=597 /DNA_ID=CAMNT_0012821063 /DNA_START=136 /DNA_END=1930 /DNA_ORIENTATION=+
MTVWLQRGLVYDQGYLEYENSLWDDVFSHLFTKHTTRWAKLFVIILDEIPHEVKDLALIGDIRDALKMVNKVVVILSGTNSKSANMIGLTSCYASSQNSEKDHSKWSYLITRLPHYFVEASELKNSWKEIQRHACCELSNSSNQDLQNAIKTIKISIQNFGNPRLIEFSISALNKLLETRGFSFEKWQLELSKMNIESKFILSKLSYAKEILVSQASLLLSVTADLEIGDSMIRRHYAQRAYPDDGLNFGLADKLCPCGGWLHIAPRYWRCLGHNLYAKNKKGECPDSPPSDWQLANFQPLVRDPILYLASCWPNGYFSIRHGICNEVVFTSMTFTMGVWRPNAIVGLKFQNPKTPINAGAHLEVAVTLAIMNAGAVHKGPKMQLCSYLQQFLIQLNIYHADISQMQCDRAFDGLYVPRLIFPVFDSPALSVTNIGTLEYIVNQGRMKAILHNILGCNKLGVHVKQITVAMKYGRETVTTILIGAMVKKHVTVHGGIAICCVKKCPLFWTNEVVRHELWGELADTLAGVVYLVNSNGNVICHTINPVQKADSSLFKLDMYLAAIHDTWYSLLQSFQLCSGVNYKLMRWPMYHSYGKG